MKTYIRLIVVFVILVLLILFAGAAANHWLLIRSERTNLELNSSSIVGSIEIVDQRFENLNLYLLQLTNSSTPQRLAIYAKTEQYPLIVSLSQQVYQNLNMVKNSFSEIKSLNLLLLESEHLLGDNYQYVRFERLPDGMFDGLMAEVERGNYISSDSKTCHLLYPMAQLLDDENQSGWLEASIYLEPLFTAIMANLSSDSLCAFEEDGVILNDEWPVELKDQDSGSWKHANGWYACAFEIPCISRQMNRHYRLAVCQPEAQFMGDLAHTYLIWTTVQTVTFLLSVIIFIVLIYKMVRKPMDRLMGILDVSPEAERALLLEDRRGDFQILYDRYTQMKSESSQKDEQIRAAMEAARQSEIKRLQAQISPHFLYNCFYQVYNLCKLEDSESAGDLSMLLAQYYEYIYKGLSNDKPLPLREEVEQAKRYLQIQQYRFVDRFDARWQELPAEMEDLPVPKLTLQPVLENAVKYTVDAVRTNGIPIRVTYRIEGEECVVCVEDGGSVSDEYVAGVNRALANGEAEGALSNVNSRLRLLYGERSGVTAGRSEWGGMKIEIRLAR